jgi:hypothetical protein
VQQGCQLVTHALCPCGWHAALMHAQFHVDVLKGSTERYYACLLTLLRSAMKLHCNRLMIVNINNSYSSMQCGSPVHHHYPHPTKLQPPVALIHDQLDDVIHPHLHKVFMPD